MSETPGERLKAARVRAGFGSASDAARSRGWKVSTYLGHENGDRVPSRETAKRYGRAFRVRWTYLLEGEGTEGTDEPMPVTGLIHPGAKVVFDENSKETAPSPPEGAGESIALLAGSSVMPGLIEDGWIVYCERAQRDPSEADIGRTCLIKLGSGDMLIGRLFRGRGDRYDAVSVTFESYRDVEIAWISRVTWIKPA